MSYASVVPRSGHQLQLLEGSVELFPALVQAIDSAQREVRMETYIFDLTGVGADVAWALERAAHRGVQVRVLVDGFGTQELPAPWRERFAQAGIEWRVYAPLGRLGVLWPGNWRRLHRKLFVIDGQIAFCGGINILDDFHDPGRAALKSPRLDFAVRVTGPLVDEVQATVSRLWLRVEALRKLRDVRVKSAIELLRAAGAGTDKTAMPGKPVRDRAHTRAALVLRDNLRNRARIERTYRRAIGRARKEIIIANAYFVPGRKMRQALISAARRGVKVRLLLQGRYEYFMQYYAARPIYGVLLANGVEIHEYSPSYLHAKVAVIDEHWATVGSSNLDPLSLLLAREANVVIDDAQFARQLRNRLLYAMQYEGKAMDPAEYGNRPWRQRAMEWVALILMRLALVVQGKKYL